MSNKLLLFGGAFNPPHKGHMRLLNNAIETVKPELTIVMPTSTSPHKESGDISFHHRYMMARVFKQFDNVKISDIENRGRKRKNYTIGTLKWLEKRYKGYEIYLLIGSDMLLSFKTWSRYKRILSKATLVVASREKDDMELKKAVEQLKKEGARIELISFTPLVISSSELRESIKQGKDVDKYLEDSVREYIYTQCLYL